ncbi:MAG: hypothetical protein EOO77_37185 [Oxalobacteraceae bacterium]|nr:MAG: hypothetical protein EOO77_37185 [Oxalobacteraceae bacterium]
MSDETIEPAVDVASSHTTGRIEIVGRHMSKSRRSISASSALAIMSFARPVVCSYALSSSASVTSLSFGLGSSILGGYALPAD